eukprot:CAMPEP_0197657548 /NCGR_PEP_ID=MMETSP1338-20131121/44694_1 /TAXON_ID=43686 ORGANISM="Pelagodinium beii, Strain RCC1491" /NCGR_SAMPLE_ID=MMETSP1338 /ASSEMBLY_ACC=CAM_ASM_000754 /LENGTH=292 /DNA_ID=CAMNT_0043233941 /DNA_START=86 /DNA_END=961 /DNA_ORIENTATION=+
MGFLLKLLTSLQAPGETNVKSHNDCLGGSPVMLKMKNAFLEFGMRSYRARPPLSPGVSSPEEPCRPPENSKTNFHGFDQREGGGSPMEKPNGVSETQAVKTPKVVPARSPEVVVPCLTELDESPKSIVRASLKAQQEAPLPFSDLLVAALAATAKASARQRAEQGECSLLTSTNEASPLQTRSMTPCRRKLQDESAESSEKGGAAPSKTTLKAAQKVAEGTRPARSQRDEVVGRLLLMAGVWVYHSRIVVVFGDDSDVVVYHITMHFESCHVTAFSPRSIAAPQLWRNVNCL